MRKIILFIAMSLDGYIADTDGGVDWLSGQTPDADDMVSYYEFIRDIDTVIMGAKTYHQITAELSPDDWIYHGLTSYVITHHPVQSTDEIKFTDENPSQLVKRLKALDGKGIWICGGATIAGRLIKDDLINKYYISVIPTILGGGIRLFDTAEKELKLKLIESKSYNGITDLVYERR